MSEAEEPPPTEAPLTGWRWAWSRKAFVLSPAMLVGGVLWDFATLQIHRVRDNVFLGIYLALFIACAILELRSSMKTGLPDWLETRMHWVHYAGQFMLGGLLSAYLIHYFQGAPFLRGMVWVLVLAAAATLNELLPVWLKRPEAWAPLVAVLTLNYILAAGPVITGYFVGIAVPMVGAVLAVCIVHFCSAIPYRGITPLQMRRTLLGSSYGVGLVLWLELLAWHYDWIPPIPLTLMDTEVVPERHEAYEVGVSDQALANLGFARTLVWTPGLKVRVNTPVYLPKSMETRIQHVWEFYDPELGWTQTDSIGLDIRGGRQEGFRTYSHKRSLKPGGWRVRVTTKDGRELGRVRFDLDTQK